MRLPGWAWLGGAIVFAAAFACSSSEPSTDTPVVRASCTYPTGGQADRSFDALSEDGTETHTSFSDLRCAAPDKLLVVRVHAMSSGTGQWDAKHLGDTLDGATRSRARIVDLLVTDDDNSPAGPDDRAIWQARQDIKTLVAVDPNSAWSVAGKPLPRVLVIDPRTMTVTSDLDDPGPDATSDAVAAALASMDGRPAPAPQPRVLVDGLFDRRQWKMLEETRIAGTPPADPTNRFSDDVRAAELGKQLFEDVTLSPRGDVSCEACHEKSRAMTDGSPIATRGVGPGSRNTPTMVFAAWGRWQLWDGRADSLWMQALLPMEDTTEFGSSRVFIAHRIADSYARQYQDVFGALPNLSDQARFPMTGRPGDPQYEAMTKDDQLAVTQIFVNVGKAIAAFERTFRVNASRVDLYATKYLDQLSPQEKSGALAFFESGCAQCHWGKRLTDDAFHNVRYPTGSKAFVLDPGRRDGVPKYFASAFRADGAYSDAKQPPRVIKSTPLGAFKTPALRGVAYTAPYGHGGSVPNLQYAVEIHRTRGLPADSNLAEGEADPRLVAFDASKTPDLVAFLSALDLFFVSQ